MPSRLSLCRSNPSGQSALVGSGAVQSRSLDDALDLAPPSAMRATDLLLRRRCTLPRRAAAAARRRGAPSVRSFDVVARGLRIAVAGSACDHASHFEPVRRLQFDRGHAAPSGFAGLSGRDSIASSLGRSGSPREAARTATPLRIEFRGHARPLPSYGLSAGLDPPPRLGIDLQAVGGLGVRYFAVARGPFASFSLSGRARRAKRPPPVQLRAGLRSVPSTGPRSRGPAPVCSRRKVRGTKPLPLDCQPFRVMPAVF